ncbi:MAG: mandelate racemase/muconate lactonizing enzyme family protein [Woeseiaceae bacterium]
MKIEAIETFLMHAEGPAGLHTSAYPESLSPQSDDASGLSSEGSRHWLFVRVQCENGLAGLGEASGWPLVQRTAIQDLAQVVIGQDARQIAAITERLKLAMMPHGTMGTFASGIIAAIDMALWDLKGKSLDVPVWQLLGGNMRDRIPLYCHAGNALAAREAISLGYNGIKLSGHTKIVERATAVREAFPDLDVMVDLHGPPWLTTANSQALCQKLEKLDLTFVEEPVAPENAAGLRQIRNTVKVPIASGERLGDISDFTRLIVGGHVDVVQPDTGRAGGISGMKKIAAIAESQFVNVAPHSGSLGPIAEYAAVHLLASIPNCLYLERFADDWPGREAVLSVPLAFRDGAFLLPDRPGLGVELLDEEVKGYTPRCNSRIPDDPPYERARYFK